MQVSAFANQMLFTVVIRRPPCHALTDVHSGLAPEKQLQTLRFPVHTTVVEGCIAQGCLLIQVPTEKIKLLEKNDSLLHN